MWESCLLSEIGAGVLVQPLVWEFSLGCLGSHRVLLALATDTLLACLRILLSVRAHVFPKVCLKPEQVLRVYEVAQPLMFSLLKSLALASE